MGLEKYRTVKSWWYMQYSRNHLSIKSRFDLYDIKWSNTMLYVNQLAVTWFCFCFQLWLINVREHIELRLILLRRECFGNYRRWQWFILKYDFSFVFLLDLLFYVFLADSGCPFGWMITDNSCFYFSNFTDPTQILTWSQAKQWCASKSFPAGNAKLVTLDNVNDGVSPFFL